MERIKVIGTGLSGLIGSRIVELLNDEFDFVDFSRNTGIDILNFRRLKEAFEKHQRAEAVLHLAAFTDTNAAWEQRGDKGGECYRVNVEGTKNIVDLCFEHKKYLIYFSTDFVFNGKKDGPYTEEDVPDPIEWYGYTKYLGEVLVEKSGLSAAIVRIAFPFRAKFESKKDVVRKIIERLRKKSLYPMFADQITTPTFIDDIALGIKYFIRQKPEGIFHLVASSYQSPYEMALSIAGVFGFDKGLVKKGSLQEYQKTLPVGSRPWQRNLALSNRKIKGLGIEMSSLKEALLEVKKQMGG